MRHKSVKQTDFLSPHAFFQAQNVTKPIFGRGSIPDPGGEFTTLPHTP